LIQTLIRKISTEYAQRSSFLVSENTLFNLLNWPHITHLSMTIIALNDREFALIPTMGYVTHYMNHALSI